MKRIMIMLAISTLFISGCKSNHINSTDDDTIFIYTDSETCVEYIKYAVGYKGGITVRLNTDGSIKLNEKCMFGLVGD